MHLTDDNLHSEAPRSWIESGQCPTPTPKSECPPVVLPVERKIALNSVVFFDELREPLPQWSLGSNRNNHGFYRRRMLLVNGRSNAHVDSVALSAVHQLRRDREDFATAAIFLVLKPRRISCRPRTSTNRANIASVHNADKTGKVVEIDALSNL